MLSALPLPSSFAHTALHVDLQTLYCGNTAADQIVQITKQALRLIDAGTQQLVQDWRPPNGLSINVAAASPTQVKICGSDQSSAE